MKDRRVDWLITQLNILGGAETFISQLALLMQEANWDLRIISLTRGGVLPDELRAQGVPLVELGAGSKLDLRIAFKLLRLWRSDPPEILHTFLYHAGILGRLLGRMTGIPHILVHQTGPEFARSRLRISLDRLTSCLVDWYVVPCDAISQVLQRREKVSADKIVQIPNGISLPVQANDRHTREVLIPSKGVPVLICVGRLASEKGQSRLLRALKILFGHNERCFTVFLGEGPMKENLIEQAEQLGLSEWVMFPGLRRDVPDWLAESDIFVLPSDWEGISLALLEAMAAGLPVVATRVGGTPEVIEHGVHGLLVDPNQDEDMAKAIRSLLENTDLTTRLAEAGRQRACQNFRLERAGERMTQLYENLLAGEARP